MPPLTNWLSPNPFEPRSEPAVGKRVRVILPGSHTHGIIERPHERGPHDRDARWVVKLDDGSTVVVWQSLLRVENPLAANPRSGSHPIGGLIVRSDQRWKDFTYGADVPEKVRKDDFDWVDDAESSDGFFKHHGTWYHLSLFMRVETGGDLAKAGWQGYHGESFSTGVVIKVSNDGEQYMVGTYRTAPGS